MYQLYTLRYVGSLVKTKQDKQNKIKMSKISAFTELTLWGFT